jgi:membrane protease YdiL (CAAX protease family)
MQVMVPETPTVRNPALGVLLRVGVFALIAVLGYIIFPVFIDFITPSIFIVAALGSFSAAAVANAIALRIYERGQLADIGLGWSPASRRNVSLGLLGGIGAALIVLIGPIIFQAADFERIPGKHVQWGAITLVSVVLLFGAVGEEMLFRGYGFQILVRALGPFATILPIGVLFGFAHSQNLHFTWLALTNTALWGVLLGYAFIRAGDLWLPIGLHFGWNWVLPLLGVNLSGFTMDVTGLSLHWRIGELWSGGSYGPEGGLLTTGILVGLFFYLHKAPIQQQPAFLLQEPEPALQADL